MKETVRRSNAGVEYVTPVSETPVYIIPGKETSDGKLYASTPRGYLVRA